MGNSYSYSRYCIEINSIKMDPQDNNHLVAIANNDGIIKIWNFVKKRLVRIFRNKGATAVAFSSDGKLFASSGTDLTIKIWQIETAVNIATLNINDAKYVTQLAFSPDNNQIIYNCCGERVKLINIDTKKISTITVNVSSLTISKKVPMVVFNNDQINDNKLELIADGKIKLLNYEDDPDIYTINTGDSSLILTDMMLSENNERLALLNMFRVLQVWDISTGKLLCKSKINASSIAKNSFSRDGCKLATNNLNDEINIWCAETGSLIKTIKCQNPRTLFMDFFDNDKKIVAVTSNYLNKYISTWNIETEKLENNFVVDDDDDINVCAVYSHDWGIKSKY